MCNVQLYIAMLLEMGNYETRVDIYCLYRYHDTCNYWLPMWNQIDTVK